MSQSDQPAAVSPRPSSVILFYYFDKYLGKYEKKMHLTQFLFYNLIEVLCRPKWQNQETPSHFAADWWLLTVIVVSHSLNCTITEFQLRPQLCRAAVPLTCFFFSLCMRFFSANAPNVSSEVFTGLTFLHGTGPFFISGNVTKTQNDFHKDARGAVTCRKRWKRFGWLEELTLTWGYRHKQTTSSVKRCQR